MVSLLVEAHADLNLPNKVYNIICVYIRMSLTTYSLCDRDCQCNINIIVLGLGFRIYQTYHAGCE